MVLLRMFIRTVNDHVSHSLLYTLCCANSRKIPYNAEREGLKAQLGGKWCLCVTTFRKDERW